ncbi:hypothetical protein IFM89_021535 [Coptis chinensis]|uniref:Pyruvate kinase n=1 Tax=Coptis chinensis TaxID=261450 RepID=A0A835HGK8_9MAGN|nr:hypothetical protein IFM89_021535 [Coptis chinensis]
MLETHSDSLNSKVNGNPTTPDLDIMGDTKATWEYSNQKDKGEFTINTFRKKASSHIETLLGPLRDEKSTHIMVTVGKEATENDMLLSDLLKAGATIIIINCAYGDPSVWSEVIRRAKRISQMLEKPCVGSYGFSWTKA